MGFNRVHLEAVPIIYKLTQVHGNAAHALCMAYCYNYLLSLALVFSLLYACMPVIVFKLVTALHPSSICVTFSFSSKPQMLATRLTV